MAVNTGTSGLDDPRSVLPVAKGQPQVFNVTGIDSTGLFIGSNPAHFVTTAPAGATFQGWYIVVTSTTAQDGACGPSLADSAILLRRAGTTTHSPVIMPGDGPLYVRSLGGLNINVAGFRF